MVRWKKLLLYSIIIYFKIIRKIEFVFEIDLFMILDYIVYEKECIENVIVNKKICLIKYLFKFNDILFDWMKVLILSVIRKIIDMLLDIEI